MKRMLSQPILISIVFFAATHLVMAQNNSNYQEPHRPQFHFSPEKAWMNDPNGMVYYDGEYHLFYQYYPYASVWGPMHWGHAVSKDLVHWEHLPIALYPDKHGFIFSGSAVVDWNNTSGLGDGQTPPMVAIFTYHNMEGEKSQRTDYQSQGIAYSLDKGRTWTKYPGNPVLPNQGIKDFRDPKVIWHQPTQQWVMILAVKNRIQLYNSPNLKEWTLASELGLGTATQLGVWECPDLFPLKVEGEDREKWIMIISHGGGGPNGGSCTRYLVGDFDGKVFKSDYPLNQINWLDYGKDNYAGVTWSDVPQADGRRLFIGWMSNWQYATRVPTTKWRSTMTIARKLTLKNTDAGIKLLANPVQEMEALRGKTVQLSEKTIVGKEVISGVNTKLTEVMTEFNVAASNSRFFGLEWTNSRGEYIRLGFDQASQLIIFDRSHSGKVSFSSGFSNLQYIPYTPGETMKWRIFVDKSSIEIFVDDGVTVITDIFFPNEDFDELRLFAIDGSAQLNSGRVYELNGIW